MSTTMEEMAKGLTAAWSCGDVDGIASFFTEDGVFEDVCSRELHTGHEALKALAREVFAAIPDMKLTITSCLCEGNRMAVEWVQTGTRAGRRFSLPGVSIADVRDGKFSREAMYCHWDAVTWLDA